MRAAMCTYERTDYRQINSLQEKKKETPHTDCQRLPRTNVEKQLKLQERTILIKISFN